MIASYLSSYGLDGKIPCNFVRYSANWQIAVLIMVIRACHTYFGISHYRSYPDGNGKSTDMTLKLTILTLDHTLRTVCQFNVRDCR